MTVTSIDDVVEQGIHDVISGMSHLARCIHARAGTLAMHCRRIITIIAFIAFGFLFRVEFLLAIAIAPLAVGAISLCARRAITVRLVHPAPSNDADALQPARRFPACTTSPFADHNAETA